MFEFVVYCCRVYEFVFEIMDIVFEEVRYGVIE